MPRKHQSMPSYSWLLPSKATALVIGVIIVVSVPPPRAFAAVAGDLVQLMVLFGAILIPVWIILVSADPTAAGFFSAEGVEVMETALARKQARVLATGATYIAAIVALIGAKMICVWFEPHVWAHWLCRIAAGCAGGIVAFACTQLIVALIEAGRWQSMRSIISSVKYDVAQQKAERKE